MHGVTDIQSLQALIDTGVTVQYLMFWGHTPRLADEVDRSCFSQWYPSPFEVGGERYATAEHYMMVAKARLFGDLAIVPRILAAATPAVAKQLGREVQGYDEAVWLAQRFDIVVRGNLAKFQQNPECGEFLAGTLDQVLVEASPVDRIWGIGLAADDPAARVPAQWQGLNLLGFALMQVREHV
ncbi:NADAR family protein [Pseudomonas sp. TE3610]